MQPTVKQHKSGITTVLFNTTDKWMEFNARLETLKGNV